MTIIIDESESVPEQIPDYECAGCRHTVVAEEPHIVLSVGPLCADCHGVCYDCGGDFNMNSGSIHAATGDGEYVCNRCTRSNWRVCNDCNDWEHVDSVATVYGDYVCHYCLEQNYSYCDSCDEYRSSDDYEHFDNCGESLMVNDYSYRPTPSFRNTAEEFDNAPIIVHDTDGFMRKFRKIAYMGFELEVECRGDRDDYRHGAGAFRDIDVVYLKQDGSLNYGFEIVTHPMTLGYVMAQQELWDTIESLPKIGFDAWGTNTAGLHVHVSRDGFINESHQARFVHFIHRNEEFLSWLAGRSGSRWASYSKEQLRDLRLKLRRNLTTDRYMAVNLNNSGTLEVRIFRSSLRPERIKMALQLVDAIVNYTEKLSASQMVVGDAASAQAFIKWAEPQSKYAILSDYVTRWVEPFQSGLPQIGE